MHTRTLTVGAAVGCAVLTMIGCSEKSPAAPGVSAAFQVTFRPSAGSQASGIRRFEIVGDDFTAYVQAVGVEPSQRIPQHIHLNPTCNPGGGVLINLDQNLTVAGEAP